MTKVAIPKIIHYVWLGENKKPKNILKYIETWKKYCPDYEIKEWNNEILKEIDNQFAKEAYECKKYAFASDYIRLYVLKKYGGIYLDTDVELTQNLDAFLDNSFFAGQEKFQGELAHTATNLIGAIEDCKIIDFLLKEYDNMTFITEDGEYNMIPNPVIFENCLKEKYEHYDTNGFNTVELEKNNIIYPYWYFSKPKKGEENYAIHHFMKTWRKENLSIRKWFFSFHKHSTTHFMIILFGIKMKFKHKNKV